MPESFGNSLIRKLLKKYGHIIAPKVVHLYPFRDCRYGDSTYRVLAMPVNGESKYPEERWKAL